MSEDYIDYGKLIDDAMQIIVRRALELAVKEGLPGDHHFFISFITDFPGVKISDKLKKKYPDEMTIVLQYQFDELKVDEEGFSVVLSFDNVKERLEIPFSALTAFADPSVKFGLQFHNIDADFDEEELLEELEYLEEEEAKGKKSKRGKKSAKKADNVVSLDKFRKK